jgi:hypothetical protein
MSSAKVIELRIKQANAKLKTQTAAVNVTKARVAKLKKDLATAKATEKAAPKPAKKIKKAVAKVAAKKSVKTAKPGRPAAKKVAVKVVAPKATKVAKVAKATPKKKAVVAKRAYNKKAKTVQAE